MFTAEQLQKKYLEFFRQYGHAVIPNASLIPENDPTALFTSAGMHPLVPYLLMGPHPAGKRITKVQKCIRTCDIDEIGDATHLTFFLMLGNWSFGDYFKKEAIEMSCEFLTNRKWLGLDKNKLSVTVFAGDVDAPRDDESAAIWEKLGIPKERIFYNGKKDNWWGPVGTTGPCGPDTEMFYDMGKEKCSLNCAPGCGCGKYFEIWNDVFMEYNKTKDGKYSPLKQKNVDTGMGLERTVAMLNDKDSVYDTELFTPVFECLEKLGAKGDVKSKRIVADHIRAAVFILADEHGVVPSNVDQGYVLRRLIRRAVRHGRLLGIEEKFVSKIAEKVIETEGREWQELTQKKTFIIDELNKEEEKFAKTVEKGTNEINKMIEKNKKITAKDAFLLYQSFGFPVEMTIEIAAEKGIHVERGAFEKEFEKHQQVSRAGAEKKFKSGLADTQEETVKLHTAAHLLLAALRKVLKPDIIQKGSNITAERLRLDFSYDAKPTAKQLAEIEKLVNGQIDKKLEVKREEMMVEEAKKGGALAVFTERYPERVSVFSVGDFSKEICTGPHVSNTKELGKFRIIKEESVSAGVRRIKAVLEKK